MLTPDEKKKIHEIIDNCQDHPLLWVWDRLIEEGLDDARNKVEDVNNFNSDNAAMGIGQIKAYKRMRDLPGHFLRMKKYGRSDEPEE